MYIYIWIDGWCYWCCIVCLFVYDCVQATYCVSFSLFVCIMYHGEGGCLFLIFWFWFSPSKSPHKFFYKMQLKWPHMFCLTRQSIGKEHTKNAWLKVGPPCSRKKQKHTKQKSNWNSKQHNTIQGFPNSMGYYQIPCLYIVCFISFFPFFLFLKINLNM